MSDVAPVLFKSTASGAPSLTGEVGTLLNVLDHCLIIGSVFAFDGTSFTDRTPEARTNGGTAFPLLPDGDTNDICYFGSSQKFKHLGFDLDTVGVGGTWVWEYWNGGWVTLSVTDGTSGFTQDGKVLWTAPGDWVTTSINGVTQFWVRVRASVAPSTNPTVFSATAMGWLRYTTPDPGANNAVYRMGGGRQHYIEIRDDGSITDARNAGTRGWEDWPGQVLAFPTAAQVASPYMRKSSTANSTARTWKLLCDDRTFYLFNISGGDGTKYFMTLFGDFYSYVPGDLYRTVLIYRSQGTGEIGDTSFLLRNMVQATSIAGHYVARATSGLGGSKPIGKSSDGGKGGGGEVSATAGFEGFINVWNGPDGGLYMAEVFLHEDSNKVRGRLRGLWCPLHPVGFAADGDVWSGVGAVAGRSFEAVYPHPGSHTTLTYTTGTYVCETSDTWDTN